MKVIFFFTFFMLSGHLMAKSYTMKLTLIDASNNSPIIGDSVALDAINVGFSSKFITDDTGTISFTFESRRVDVVEYDFYILSGKYLGQTRERYLKDQTLIEITFYMYPDTEYAAEINSRENEVMAALSIENSRNSCIESYYKSQDFLNSLFIDNNLQTPMHIGDYGWLAKFKVSFKLTSTGQALGINILESTHQDLNQEIVRLIRLMPEWPDQQCSKDTYREMTIDIVIDNEL